MRRVALLVIALIAGVLLAPLARPAAADVVQLVGGCQIRSLAAYPIGTPLSTVTADISGGNPRLWFLAPGTNVFMLFDPRSIERSTTTLLGPNDDAAFICLDSDAAWDRGRSVATATPTITVTPTLTPTSTSSPTPTATAAPPGAGYGLRGVTTYTDSIGALHVVGEVVNDSGRNGRSVQISAAFYDGADNVIATGAASSCLRIVQNGGQSPFEILVLEPPTNIARYTLQIEAQATSEAPPTGLVLSGVATRMDSLGVYHITGRITNQSTATYDSVLVCSSMYNGAGAVVRVESSFAHPRTLLPSAAATFEVLEPDIEPASYRLWVDAQAR